MIRRACHLLVACTALALAGRAQSPAPQGAPLPTLHIGTTLTLLDVIVDSEVRKLHTRQLLTGLGKEDFRLYENDKQVPIVSFDSGSQATTQPITLWLIVQCNSPIRTEWSSAFLRGHTGSLKPVLQALHPADQIAVAHWCDNGDATVDLPPGNDPSAALHAVDSILQQPSVFGVSRTGEVALQKMIRMTLDATATRTTGHLPVLLFIYGDHSATYPNEAQAILTNLLEHSGLVFGIDEDTSGMDQRFNSGAPGQITHLAHYYSNATGGQYYAVENASLIANALGYILAQAHMRYVLGFKPSSIDNKPHTLRVELTPEARQRYGSVQLKYREQFIPTTAPR